MALIDTFPQDAKSYEFEWLRRMLKVAPLQEGVLDAGDFKVTAAAAGGMRVDVAAGAMLVQADTGFRMGLFLQINDAAIANAVTFDASHATLPRVDRVILRVNDTDDLASATDVPTLEKVNGVPTAGATLDNENGIAALPDNALLLATVLIPAASSAVTAGNVRDRRKWARGAFRRILRNVSNYVTSSSSFAAMDATNLSPRVECSGAPLSISLTGELSHTVANSRIRFEFRADGVAIDNQEIVVGTPAGASDVTSMSPEWTTVPVAGSRLLAPHFRIDSGTGTVYATPSDPLVLVIEERLRQDADNT